jgi:uncharacterized membrane protein YfhO
MSILGRPVTSIKNRLFILLSFLIPMIILGGIYINLGVFPFGHRSILVVDLSGQYIDFYSALRRMVFAGNSPFYSWSKALGGNMLGIISYYLSSPFSIITLIFPEKYLIESILVMTLAKVGCSGLAMYIYLTKSQKANGIEALIFSIPYALMSYVVMYSYNIMWIDGIILLPFLALGIEKIVEYERFTIFYVSLTVMLIANYYIGYMLCIFSAIYFLYLVALKFKPNQITSVFKRLALFIFVSLLSVGSVAFLLLPTYFTLIAGKLGFDNSLFSLAPNFNVLDILPKLLFGSYDTALGHLPNLYCGLSMLFLTLIFFISDRISLLNKICSAIFLVVILLSFYLSGLNLIWHGFQLPVSFPFRYSFIFSFFIICLAYQSFQKLTLMSKPTFVIGLIVAILIVIFVKLRGYNFLSIPILIVSFVLFCVYFAILYFYKQNKRILVVLFGGIVLLEAGFNSLIFIHKIDQEFGYQDRTTYTRFNYQLQPLLNKIEGKDPGYYRIEKTFYRSYNDALGLGYKGISHFSSSFNSSTYSFLKQLGFLQAGYSVLYTGQTVPANSILGIKYILSQQPEMYGYQEIDRLETKTEDLHIFQNSFPLPLGFMVNHELSNVNMNNFNPILLQNQILQKMVGNLSDQYFYPVKIEKVTLTNVSSQISTGMVRYSKVNSEKDGTIQYKFIVENENPIYAYLLTSLKDNNKVEVLLNGKSLGYYGENSENNNVLLLNNYIPGQEVSFTLKLMENSVILMDEPQIYQLDMALFTQAYNHLSLNPLLITSFKDTSIRGNVNVTGENMLLYTSIPYDNGWTAYIDNKPTDKIKLLNTFIGIEVPEGYHQIYFSYAPQGLLVGCVITVISLLLAGFFLHHVRTSRLTHE